MKIVNIILTSQNGGAEQVFIDYMIALKGLGHEVLAVTKSDSPYYDQVLKLGIDVKKIDNRFGDYDFFTVKEIKKILREFRADTVLAHARRSTVLARKAIKKNKDKKIFLIAVNHSMNVKRSIGADIVLSVNKEIFFRTVDLGQSEEKSFVIANAIDLSDITAHPQLTNLSQKKDIVIGVMGRLDDEIKGFDHAIKAIKQLVDLSSKTASSSKKFILKIAGSGVIENSLRRLAKELGLENNIEFSGWVNDKKSFFDSIDIFCLTSRRETFGLVLLEAMKFAKPIISTAADGPKQILRHEIDGLLIDAEPFDNLEERLAQSVIRLINDENLVKKMIENSLLRVKEKFSYEMLKESLSEIVGDASKVN